MSAEPIGFVELLLLFLKHKIIRFGPFRIIIMISKNNLFSKLLALN